MKMSKILSLVLAALMLVACFASCTTPGTNEETTAGSTENNNVSAELAGTYDITMWVSEKEGVAALTQKQIQAFMAANPGIVINAKIEGVTEADAGSLVVADVATAPDIYCLRRTSWLAWFRPPLWPLPVRWPQRTSRTPTMPALLPLLPWPVLCTLTP